MKQHKRRIDKLSQQLPTDDDDTIVIIRLVWGGAEDPEKPPIVCRQGPDGKLIKVGIDTIPPHLRRPTIVNTTWDDSEYRDLLEDL